MNIWLYQTLQFLSISLSSILVGYLFFQNHIFDSHLTAFQFVISGALVACFIIAREISIKALLYASLLSLLILLILMRPDSPSSFIKWTIYILTLNFCVTASLNFNHRLNRLPVGKFVIWSLFFGSFHLAAFLLQTLLTQSPYHQPMATNFYQIATLLGAATGLSYELTTHLKPPSSKDE